MTSIFAILFFTLTQLIVEQQLADNIVPQRLILNSLVRVVVFFRLSRMVLPTMVSPNASVMSVVVSY